MASIGVVVVAAGSGSRLGASVPKAYAELGGKTLLQRSLEPVLELANGSGEGVAIVVVASRDWYERADEICRAISPDRQSIVVVEGGSERHHSVVIGLSALVALDEQIDVVLVHDAARPLTPVSQFRAVADEVRRTGEGVVPGLAVTDTIKRLDADGHVAETIDRSQLASMQTPQGFPLLELVDAYAESEEVLTDDAAVYASVGHAVRVIPGDPLAFKITTADDLARAEGLLTPRTNLTRTGIGIDVHAFDVTQPLWLGGLFWPGETGLAGHSDGDAVAHAICDALLSAAGLGDIGSTFGTDDPRFENAHGEVFLTATMQLLKDAGFQVENVSVQVIGQRPRVSARRAEVEATLTALVTAPISVSATTSDGLGFTGRGEGIAAIATALVSASVR